MSQPCSIAVDKYKLWYEQCLCACSTSYIQGEMMQGINCYLVHTEQLLIVTEPQTRPVDGIKWSCVYTVT